MNKIYSTQAQEEMKQGLITLEENLQTDQTWQHLQKNVNSFEDGSADFFAQNEDFWSIIRSAYSLNDTVLNLNHGSINPMPDIVVKALKQFTQLCNELPGYWFFEGFSEKKEVLRQRLSVLCGVNSEEVSIQRNTSTAIETIIFGLPLAKGDEVILSRQDYPTLVYAWKQREKYDGIRLKWVDIPMPSEDENQLISAYSEAVGPRTKILQIMQMFNWNGQLIPVRGISKKLKDSGTELLVDGAHLPGHLPVNVNNDACHYWGASLHKWVSAPVGTGIMTIRKDLISKIRPMMGAAEPESSDIRKFETFGIYNMPLELAALKALDFLEVVGLERKKSRLHFLKNYCLGKLSEIKGVKTHSPMNEDFSGALGLFSLEGIHPRDLQSRLFKDYNIYTVGFDYAGISGVRISPNVYHSLKEMDHLVNAVFNISKK